MKNSKLLSIPLLFISGLGLLARIRIGNSFNLGLLAVLVLTVIYWKMEKKKAIHAFFFLFASYILGALFLSVPIKIILFLSGCGFIYWGYKQNGIEKPPLSLVMRDLFLGPLTLLRLVFRS